MRVLAFLAAALPVALAAKGTISYDTAYDSSSVSTLDLACSDGSHGLYTKGYKTIGELKTFPYVGGAPAIPGWNSPACGSCYKITYDGKSIIYTAVDKAKTFNMGLNAMNKLTNGQAKKLGSAAVTYEQVSPKQCGL